MTRMKLFKIRFYIMGILYVLIFVSCNSPKNQEKKLRSKLEGSEYMKSQDAQVSQELLELELEYSKMLAPITVLKTTHSRTYWFIVSWLKTAYRTPDWSGYYSDEWMKRTKQKGIDCSGFSRVMLSQIYSKEVAGSSQGVLDHYCIPIGMSSLQMGDLVFFKAPNSKKERIVHVGVYLMDTYFVHATSTKSAAIGLGLSVNSLEENNWAVEFVSGGRVKD